MKEAQDMEQSMTVQEAKEANLSPADEKISLQPEVSRHRQLKWWIKMIIYSVFVLSGQSIATVLGQLYFDKGGRSKWMATFVQTAGFPILVPFLFISTTKNNNTTTATTTAEPNTTRKPSSLVLASLFLFLGFFLAADCMLYSLGMLYLPASTFALLCASQLGFNALFSFFLNAQKFTPLIVNSLVLLTISSTLLVFQDDESKETYKKGKYGLGFICTIGASAGYALMLSATQLAFHKILKRENFKVILEMIIYQSLISSFFILIGLFSSKEWMDLEKEMDKYKLGKSAYVLTLVWIALSWQIFNIGAVGLILEVSSLFSNVISTLGLPIVPVVAVFVFGDKVTGVKVIAMLLAIWGFVSYIYQHYLDDQELKAEGKTRVSQVSLVERQ